MRFAQTAAFIGLGAVLVSFASLSFMACGDEGDSSGDPNATNVDAGFGGPDPSIEALANECNAVKTAAIEEFAKNPSGPIPAGFRDDIELETLTAASAAYARGETSIALSPSGCSRMFVRRDNGTVVEERIVRGPFMANVDGTSGAISYRATSDARWQYTTTGETFIGDYNGDGVADNTLTVTYGSKAIAEELTVGTVVARTTSTIVAGGESVQVIEERKRQGVLATYRTFTASMIQPTCNGLEDDPPPPDPNAPPVEYSSGVRDCTPQEQAVLTERTSLALQRGSGCLFYAGLTAESDQVLKRVVRQDLTFKCVDQPMGQWVAANDHGYMQLNPGRARILVNSPFFSGSPGFQAGTIGHELFHSFDAHDPALEAAANEEQLRRSDKVYACEYLCFGSMPDECHLAACQGKKVSTSWMGKTCNGTLKKSDKSRIEEARGDGVRIASCDSDQHVGALCRSAMGGTKVRFCTTAMECDAACEQPCESKSLSCLPECR